MNPTDPTSDEKSEGDNSRDVSSTFNKLSGSHLLRFIAAIVAVHVGIVSSGGEASREEVEMRSEEIGRVRKE